MSAADELYQWLIAPIEERMMRAAMRLVRDPDEAADVFQNALAQVWRDLPRITGHPNPHAYIMKICVNASYDALRRRARRQRRETPLEEGHEPATEDHLVTELIGRETREELLGLIATLPRKQAQALLMRAVEEQPFDAIAATMGCTEATVRSHISKAREKLRVIFSRRTAAAPAATPTREVKV